MKIPSHIYGALGGAAVASLAWILFSPSGDSASKPEKQPQVHSPYKPISALAKTHPGSQTKNPAAIHVVSETGNGNQVTDTSAGTISATGDPPYPLAATPKSRQARTETIPPRDELIARAVIVEDQANTRLQGLTSRLGLTEEQQDRIFPILARSSPAFHPILRPEGNANKLTDSVFGDRDTIKPGASVAEVENEIYPELDETQQASLEEEAMDREAWWEDIVALLAEDLTQPTVTSADVNLNNEKPVDPTQEPVNQSQREAAATVNAIDDFSSLLRGK
jgi:hypothetical protein